MCHRSTFIVPLHNFCSIWNIFHSCFHAKMKNKNNKASFRTFERCSRSKNNFFLKAYESCRCCDFSTPSGSSDRPDLSIFFNQDDRAHRRLWPFPRPDKVMRGGRQVELVGDIRRGEVVHFVVINDAGRGRHYLGTETTTENNLHRLKDTTKTDFQ